MENNELQKIWKSVDKEINQNSKEELNLLLTSKTRQTINKFLITVSISIIVSFGFLVYLTVTSLNRREDLIYLINNITLGIVTIISFLSGLLTWYYLHNYKFNQPLKNWLEVRISHLDKGLNGRFSKLYFVLIPVLCVLTVLSIHVYFENNLFTEVLKAEESIIGLIVGMPIGIFVAYFAVRKIRKYQLNTLEFLKDLYTRLCNVH